MNSDSYKAWIDAMPVDDVRRRIERLERKLSDLHVLERLHADRQGAQGEEPPAGDEEGAPSEHGEGETEGWSGGEQAPPEHG
jgi:hypothetical protein